MWWSWKLFVNGHLDEMAYDIGAVDRNFPFAELKARSRINQRAQAADSDPDFSQKIRVGLRVPPEPERCFMEVGEVRCRWQEGQVLIFDDTYPHAVSNATDQERVVLLFDFRRPLSVRGRFVRQVMFWVFRRTAFVREALRNEMRWEQRYRDAGA